MAIVVAALGSAPVRRLHKTKEVRKHCTLLYTLLECVGHSDGHGYAPIVRILHFISQWSFTVVTKIWTLFEATWAIETIRTITNSL